MTPLSRCSPCFGDNCPAFLPHSLVYCELFEAEPDSRCAAYETYCSCRPCDGGPVAARGGAAPRPSVQVTPALVHPLQAYKEQPCLGDFYERDLNMPVSSGLDSALCLLESPSHWWLSDFSFGFNRWFSLVITVWRRADMTPQLSFLWISVEFTVRAQKNRITEGRALTCAASLAWTCAGYSCALTRCWGFHVVQTTAFKSYWLEVRASGRTDVVGRGCFLWDELKLN